MHGIKCSVSSFWTRSLTHVGLKRITMTQKMCKHQLYMQTKAFIILYWMKLTCSTSDQTISFLLLLFKRWNLFSFSIIQYHMRVLQFFLSIGVTFFWHHVMIVLIVLISTYFFSSKYHVIGLFRCASPINLPSSVKKEKMNNLTCWEHFFHLHLLVCLSTSFTWVRACVRLCACNVCIWLGGNLLDFFLIITIQSLSLFLSRSLFQRCVRMFDAYFLLLFLHGGWVLLYVFKYNFSFDLFSSLENRFYFGHFGWWARARTHMHRHTKTQAAKWQMNIRDEKNTRRIVIS